MKPGINRRQFMQKSLVGVAAAPSSPTCWAARRRRSRRPCSPNDRIQVGIIGVGARAAKSGLLEAAVAAAGRRGDRRVRRLQGPRDAAPSSDLGGQGEGLRRLPRAARGQVDRRRDHRHPRPLAQAAGPRGVRRGQGRLPREADDAHDRRRARDVSRRPRRRGASSRSAARASARSCRRRRARSSSPASSGRST